MSFKQTQVSLQKSEPALWLLFRERELLVKNRIRLLAKIEETGSLSRAAKAVDLSYKAAWDTVDALNNLAEKPLVTKSTGGRAGGGSELTEYGREILQAYHALEAEYQRMTTRKGVTFDSFRKTARILDRLVLRISARNQFYGVVDHVSVGLVNTEVTLRVSKNIRLSALLTREGANALGLKKGISAIALFKAPSVS